MPRNLTAKARKGTFPAHNRASLGELIIVEQDDVIEHLYDIDALATAVAASAAADAEAAAEAEEAWAIAARKGAETDSDCESSGSSTM